MIKSISSPKDAAKIGRDRNNPLRTDWENFKDNIMRFSSLEKFKKNNDIKIKPLKKNNSYLIEHTKNDSYWADGGDGTGKNMLGIILMETREILKLECAGFELLYSK